MLNKLILKSCIVAGGISVVVLIILIIGKPQYESKAYVRTAIVSNTVIDNLKIFDEDIIRQGLATKKAIARDDVFSIYAPRHSDIIIVSGISFRPDRAKEIADAVSVEIISYQNDLISAYESQDKEYVNILKYNMDVYDKISKEMYVLKNKEFNGSRQSGEIIRGYIDGYMQAQNILREYREKLVVAERNALARKSEIIFKGTLPESQKVTMVSRAFFSLTIGLLIAAIYFLFFWTKLRV